MSEETPSYRFDSFLLDVANRRLSKAGVVVDLNARYFDALVLLVRESGQLVEKERFFEDVWHDVVVSDSALTQCIKDIRKRLGDSAGTPRYIETVPRYGYRFVAKVVPVASDGGGVQYPDLAHDVVAETTGKASEVGAKLASSLVRDITRWGGAGTLGGAFAGVLGGLLYGSSLAAIPADPGLGTASILVVLVSINVVLGLLGGLGVSFGMATASLFSRQPPNFSILGAALGGLIIGGLTKLLGVDAFMLLFGQAPTGIAGGLEGAALGAALALGARVGGVAGSNRSSTRAMFWLPVAGGGLFGALAGVLIPIAGGHLMGGSLELLAHSFADSKLQLDSLGRLFGEVEFGYTSQIILSGLEGLLFGICVIGTITLAFRDHPRTG